MSADAILRKIADHQLNLIVRKQAKAAGVSDKQIQRRVASGVLRTIHAGVYFFGAGELTPEQEALAACLACGEGSFVTGRTAAALRGVVSGSGPIEIVVPATRGPETPGIIPHRSKSTGPGEQTMLGCIPIATPARMLLDLARSLTREELSRACDQTFRKNLLTPRQLEEYLRSKPSPPELVRIVRDRIEHGVHDTDFEEAAERLLLEHGLPQPHRQYPFVANGRRVRFDLFYPEQRLAIEPNGRAPHWGKDQWQADHDKRIAAKMAGIEMLEFTWDDVHERPLYFAMTVGDALGLRPVKWIQKPASRRRR